jgi:hypothetical protein
VQASLTIDNNADNWLAGMFTANYAGQFDVFLRGLAALHLPFPLGGSSNHFRTAALRKAGGWAGAIAFQIFFAANVLAALIHPLFMAGLGFTLYALPTAWANTVMENAAPIFVTSLLSGYTSTIMLDVIGLRRRGLLAQAWVLMLTPLHWLLLSLAAWRALFQLIYDPQCWEKTEHGVARTSRAARSHRLLSRLRQSPEPSRQRPVNEPRREVPVDRRRPPTAQIGPGVPIAPIKIMQTARGTPLAR